MGEQTKSCPLCDGPLTKIIQPASEPVLPGDYRCPRCRDDRGGPGPRYFWATELPLEPTPADTELASLRARAEAAEAKVAELEDSILGAFATAIAGREEGEITTIERLAVERATVLEDRLAAAEAAAAGLRALLQQLADVEDCCCEGCEKHKAEVGEATCETCGYHGRFAAIKCACYDYFCPGEGGGSRGAGCFHGCLDCPFCESGERDAWELIRGLRTALAAAPPDPLRAAAARYREAVARYQAGEPGFGIPSVSEAADALLRAALLAAAVGEG